MKNQSREIQAFLILNQHILAAQGSLGIAGARSTLHFFILMR